MTALVLGFGAFGDVAENPSSRLAAALDGRRVGAAGVRLVGREMPVSYERAFECTVRWVQQLRPAFVLGVGVAVTRAEAMVEAKARRSVSRDRSDVDGVCMGEPSTGPSEIVCPSAVALAAALGLPTSEDAGDYVCNSWMYRALARDLPAGFLHVPRDGMDADSVAAGLGRFLDGAFPRS